MPHANLTPPVTLVSLLYVFCVVGRAQDTGTPTVLPIAKQDLTELEAKHEERREAFREAIATASDEKYRERIAEEFSAYWTGAVREMVAIAKEQPSRCVAKRAALWVVKYSDAGYDPHLRAAEILLEHHSRSEALGTAYSNPDGFHPVYEKLLRAGATSNPLSNSVAAGPVMRDIIPCIGVIDDRRQILARFGRHRGGCLRNVLHCGDPG